MSLEDKGPQDEPGTPLRGDVMDVAGVAEYLGFAPSTIYDKVQSREIRLAEGLTEGIPVGEPV